MKKTVSAVAALVLVIVAAHAFAQEKGAGLAIPDSAPDEYIVKKGDTLWDISGMFIGNPFEWPEIWKHNDYIRDPHWIYPGQKITLRTPKPPQPVQPKEPLPEPEPKFTPLSIRDREAPAPAPSEPSLQPAPAVESSSTVESAFASRQEPKPVYSLKSFMRSGYIAKRSELPASRIVGLEDGEANATTFDIVVVESSKDAEFAVGDKLSVLTVGDRVKHPDTGVDMGVVVRAKGIMEVISRDGRKYRCRIAECFDPIQTGDLVSVARLKTPPHFDAWVKPDREINGTILARNEKMLSIHLSDILYLDIGSEDGVRTGDRFAIVGRSGGDASGAILGELEALNVMSGETSVLVVSLKDTHVAIGDRVRLTARCRIVE